MQSGVKPKAANDPHDFVVIPSEQVKVAPSDAEITNLLRAAARHQSETSVRAASDPSVPATMPAVDTTFRATDVNAEVRARRGSFGRQVKRVVAALLLAMGIGAAALSWQTFGYAAKKALFTLAPKWAIAVSLPLDKLGLGANSAPSDDPASAANAEAAAPAQDTADNSVPVNPGNTSNPGNNAAIAATAAVPSDAAQQLQSMARDLANANQEVETLKAAVAELKASQQSMARDFAKMSEKLAEQNAKAKAAAAAPRPAPAHRPAQVYSATTAAPAAPPAYRSSSYSVQTGTASAPAATAAQPLPPPQPYAPPPMQLQPSPESAPRPPMPVQQ
jgi:hypothetical protein